MGKTKQKILLEQKTLKHLRKLASLLNIKSIYSFKKSELVDKILKESNFDISSCEKTIINEFSDFGTLKTIRIKNIKIRRISLLMVAVFLFLLSFIIYFYSDVSIDSTYLEISNNGNFEFIVDNPIPDSPPHLGSIPTTPLCGCKKEKEIKGFTVNSKRFDIQISAKESNNISYKITAPNEIKWEADFTNDTIKMKKTPFKIFLSHKVVSSKALELEFYFENHIMFLNEILPKARFYNKPIEGIMLNNIDSSAIQIVSLDDAFMQAVDLPHNSYNYGKIKDYSIQNNFESLNFKSVFPSETKYSFPFIDVMGRTNAIVLPKSASISDLNGQLLISPINENIDSINIIFFESGFSQRLQIIDTLFSAHSIEMNFFQLLDKKEYTTMIQLFDKRRGNYFYKSPFWNENDMYTFFDPPFLNKEKIGINYYGNVKYMKLNKAIGIIHSNDNHKSIVEPIQLEIIKEKLISTSQPLTLSSNTKFENQKNQIKVNGVIKNNGELLKNALFQVFYNIFLRYVLPIFTFMGSLIAITGALLGLTIFDKKSKNSALL